jgi:hypothetical protein
LDQVAGKTRTLLDTDGSTLIDTARRLDICLGD